MLKRFDELTEAQQKKVMVMYSDKSNADQYLYNFDEHGNYHGRQYTPSTGVLHIESTVPDERPTPPKPGEEDVMGNKLPKAKRSKKK